MNVDFIKIKKEIKKFCSHVPAEGFEIEYLEKAEKILALYDEANVALDKNEIDSSTLYQIYEKIKSEVE